MQVGENCFLSTIKPFSIFAFTKYQQNTRLWLTLTSENLHFNFIQVIYLIGKTSEYARYHGDSGKKLRFDWKKLLVWNFQINYTRFFLGQAVSNLLFFIEDESINANLCFQISWVFLIDLIFKKTGFYYINEYVKRLNFKLLLTNVIWKIKKRRKKINARSIFNMPDEHEDLSKCSGFKTKYIITALLSISL